MLRRFLIAVLVLFLAAVVAVDRVGEHVAAHVLAGQLQKDERLPNRPSVSIGGFPFLTQVFGGKYDDVSVTAHDFRTSDGVTITTLKAHLHGAHIPFSKVWHGSVNTVPVDRVDGVVFVSFGSVSRYLSGQSRGSFTRSRSSAHAIELTGELPLGSRTVPVHSVIVTVGVRNSAVVLEGSVRKAGVTSGLVLSVPLRALPFRINVKSVIVGTDGITATGNARNVRLGS